MYDEEENLQQVINMGGWPLCFEKIAIPNELIFTISRSLQREHHVHNFEKVKKQGQTPRDFTLIAFGQI